jgi:hypothetical protein
MTTHVDPCPGAVASTAKVPGSELRAWVHPHGWVKCGTCGLMLRYAWWDGTRHVCGRCQWGRGAK